MSDTARYYAPGLGRFISPDTVVPGNADGSLDGIALKPLTVAFHEPGFIATLQQENQQPFWFMMSDEQRQNADNPMGPANPQALNRYSYVLNSPLRYTDPSGHWTISVSLSVRFGALLGGSRAIGITFDGYGNVGTYQVSSQSSLSPDKNFNVTVGANASSALNLGFTTADTIQTTTGQSVNMGIEGEPIWGLGVDITNPQNIGQGNYGKEYVGVSVGTGPGFAADWYLETTHTEFMRSTNIPRFINGLLVEGEQSLTRMATPSNIQYP